MILFRVQKSFDALISDLLFLEFAFLFVITLLEKLMLVEDGQWKMNLTKREERRECIESELLIEECDAMESIHCLLFADETAGVDVCCDKLREHIVVL